MLASDMCNFLPQNLFCEKNKGKDDRVKMVCVTQKEIKVANTVTMTCTSAGTGSKI